MRVVCAWCNTLLNTVPPFDSDLITHSICEKCAEELLKGEQTK